MPSRLAATLLNFIVQTRLSLWPGTMVRVEGSCAAGSTRAARAQPQQVTAAFPDQHLVSVEGHGTWLVLAILGLKNTS